MYVRVYTNTHLCTQVGQLCLERATLPVTFSAQVHDSLCNSCIHLGSHSPPDSLEDVCGVQTQSMSCRFQFHQVSDEGRLHFPGEPHHSVTNQTLHRMSEQFATWKSVSCSFCRTIKHWGTILGGFIHVVFNRF